MIAAGPSGLGPAAPGLGWAAPGLGWAAATVLEQLAADDAAVVVTGRAAGLAERFARAAPERWLTAPGRQTRLSVGAGLAAGGRTAIVWCEDPADTRTAPWHLGGALVALTDSADVASAAWEAGVALVAPAWPADVAPLLLATLESGSPVCVHLHGEEVPPGPPLALELPGLGGPRTIMHGEAGRVRAAGPLVPLMVDAAWRLARRDRPVTLEQLTCLAPGDRGALGTAHPADAARGVLVEASDGGWEHVPAASRDARALAELVASRLPD